ncbi:hypothetical protein ACFP56_16670 [Paenibacillus septentrionalis]|uniref:Uncharacterized protein n=1 Tax=Paenibacillus septentrionalis TaxID=429342 RepID=A0ABW1V741_9BACL
MDVIQHLKAQKAKLVSEMQWMDKDASFDTEEGRRYAKALVKLVLINMQIEEKEKKAAHK